MSPGACRSRERFQTRTPRFAGSTVQAPALSAHSLIPPLPMFNKLSLLALLLALPLAACADADDVNDGDVAVVTDDDVMGDDVLVNEDANADMAGDMTDDVTAQATLDAVPAEGLTAMAPGTAVANIDSWIAKLDGMPEASGVVEGLRTLKTQLTTDPLDGAAIGTTLVSLGEQTTAAAGGDTALEQLGAALTSAGNGLM